MEKASLDMYELLIKLAEFLVVLGTSAWAIVRFRKEDPLRPRIEFDVDCNFWGPHHGSYLVAFTITARNKGNIEHRFADIRLRVLGIRDDRPLTEFEPYAPMVAFPEKVVQTGNIVPVDDGYYFVRPGVSQSFNYTSHVAENIRFVVVRATFKYKEDGDEHTAEKVFEVKAGA